MASVIQNWGEILRTQNLGSQDDMDVVSRWLLITRASVFPMTITSAAIGGLLAAAAPGEKSWAGFALAFLGLVLAHAANNMINDYFDLEAGVDTEGYVRGQYAPHPVLSGLVSKSGLLLAIALVNLLDLAILVSLTELRGWPVAFFALLGLFISVFYVAPPLKLKHRGLGEPGVFLVWGPLMIGGTYYVTTATLPAWVLVASLPYALLVMCVLIGKHVDKFEADSEKGIRTLPVVLGRDRALFLAQELLVSFFVLVFCLVLTGTLGVWTLLVFGAAPKLIKVLRVLNEPKPDAPPAGYPLWPLWYVAWVFLVTRLAGLLLVVGLLIDAFWPVHLT
ncbi:MAG: prenyltransferase [Myxococcota bacterium]|nr:prenyltransferase [Myxococcota bacterium]MDP6243976.1 prenyltransferase [Myxococcota bacterium]MDP7074996.1 prenyltransferase [Myxococcota bacterium]MDP7298224.1 prenyltransferase [Myxococcota bacterium]MDP7434440.1 prenyltransferase [Myxococcota bacterium]